MSLFSRRTAQFALASLVGLLLIGAMVAGYSRAVAIEQLKALGMEQQQSLASILAATVHHHIEPVLGAPRTLSVEQLRENVEAHELRRYLVNSMDGTKVVRVKIYDPSGRVVFSTEASQIGDEQVGNEGVIAAMRGEVTGEMVHKNTFNASDGLIENRDLLETYIPFRLVPDGDIVGVFEVYYDMTPLISVIDQTQREVLVGSLLIASVVFAVLLMMFRRVDRGLQREEQAAANYLREVQDARESLEQKVIDRTRELAISQRRFQDVADAAGEYIWETDTAGRFTFVSDRVRSVLGFTPQELIGHTPMEFAPAEDAVRVRAHFAKHGTDVPFTGLEHRSRTRDGGLIWLTVSAVPVRDESGVFRGHRGAAHDITASKEAHEKLRKMSLAIEQSSEIVIITDPEGVIEYVNQAFTVLYGYTADEVIGQKPSILRSEALPDEVYREMWRTIRAGDTWRGEMCNKARDGSLYWNLMAIFSLHDEEGAITHFVGLQTDITQRKLSEQALLASEARLRAVMNSVTDAIITCDADGMIDMVNPAAERLFGYGSGELVGADLRILMPAVYADQHEAYMERYASTGEGRIIGRGGREVRGARKDGTELPLELGVGEIVTGAERRFVGVLRDLTERKRAERELERTRRQYFHREKIAAMGQLAAGIVHEVGNPAAAISGAVSALRQRVSSGTVNADTVVVGHLELIAEQSDRLAAMTREIADFARPRETRRSLLDLNQVVRGAVSIMRFDARVQDLDLQLELDPELPALTGSPDQLTQVVLNLVLNAADACHESSATERRVRVSSARAGEVAVFEVSDNGVGMDEETLAQARDPYFTTKGHDKGMGLGLALCQDIIEEHRGEMSIQSTAGSGTTVRVTLPLDTEN